MARRRTTKKADEATLADNPETKVEKVEVQVEEVDESVKEDVVNKEQVEDDTIVEKATEVSTDEDVEEEFVEEQAETQTQEESEEQPEDVQVDTYVTDKQQDEAVEDKENVVFDTEEKARTWEIEKENELADKLGLPKVYDNEGKRITPSTPAMRILLERQEKTHLEKAFENSKAELEALAVSIAGDKALENVTVQHVITLFAEYLEQMSPKFTLDETTGGRLQTKLANLYDIVLNSEASVSQACLNIIVEIIRKNVSGAFSESYALRFANTMPSNKDQQLRFHAITTVFLTIANGTAKKNLARTIDTRKLLDYIPDRQAKANMSEFIS